MTNHTGTQSRGNKIIATQSSLELYIQSKIETAKSSDVVYTPLTQGLTYVVPTYSHVETMSKNSFSDKKHFGLLKSLGTHSLFSNVSVTPSHIKQTLEFKTQSFSNTNGLSMKNNKIEYHNPNLIKGTQSGYTWAPKKINATKPLGKNYMAANILNGTQSAIKNSKFGLKLGASINPARKFYAKPNNDTKKLSLMPFVQFVGELSNNAETMIKTKKVSVNGNIITDANHILVSGDIVRVGVGHYVINSDKIAIVE